MGSIIVDQNLITQLETKNSISMYENEHNNYKHFYSKNNLISDELM